VNPDPDIKIEVDEGVYEPSEDTYLLLESVCVAKGERVLEVGTGSGIIALNCAKAGARVVASDISEEAVANAKSNSMKNGIGLDVRRSDLFGGLEGRFDAIIFNPPYLASDVGPEDARLSGGTSGSELSIRFLDEVGGVLNPGGRVYLLTSSLSSRDVIARAKELYKVECVGSKDLFFERLEVHLLTDKD